MRKLLTIIAFTLLAFGTKAQVGSAVQIPLGAWPYIKPAWVQLPDDYATSSTKYPVIFFGHGAAEGSGTGATDATYQSGGYLYKIYTSTSGGPAYRIESGGWVDSTLNPKDGKYYKFIVVSVQKEGTYAFLRAEEFYKYINYIVANYRVDTNRIYLTGLSAGGEAVVGYESKYDIESRVAITQSYLPAAVVPMSAAFNLSGGDSVRSAWAFQAVSDSIPNWGFGSDPSDGYGVYTHQYINFMNLKVAGYSRFTNYVGGHGGWNNFYNPSYTENIGGVNMNIYQWMLTHTRAASGFVAAPTVNAGADQFITANNTLVTGTVGAASGHTITSYLWTKISGTGGSITSPSNISTNITGLTAGVYVYNLKVTQDDAQTANDQIQITVTTVPPFTVNAGTDISLPDTLTYTQLKGSCSNPSATFKWRLLNPVIYFETEMGHIVHPTDDTTWIFQIPYSYNQYYDYELAATVGATTIRDTVRVTPFWVTGNTPQANPPVRMVTTGDIALYPEMSIGDAIIQGANDGPSYAMGYYTSIYSNNPPISVGAGHHIWLMKGRYNTVTINLAPNSVQGTAANPVIITNYGGQFEAKGISFNNIGRYVKLTGKYQAGVSGNVNYKGHDSAYAFSRGKYGIWAHKDYSETSSRGLNLQGTAKNIDISYLEIGDGGFAGLMMNNGTGEVWDSLNFHDLYIHNTSGEGNYLGHTGDTSVQHDYFTNSTYINNRVLYTGNEILQWGQLGTNNIARNNVLVAGGLRWRSTFEPYYQANSLQMGIRSGGNKFVNNILRGSGDQNINIFLQPYSLIPKVGDTILLANNFVGDCRSFIGNYINPSNPLGTIPLSVRNNYFSNYNFQGDSVYRTSTNAGVNTNTLIKFENGTNTTTQITFKNNKYDASKTTMQFSNTSNVVNTGNTQTTITKPSFVNSGWADNFDWTRLEMWTDSVFNTYGDESGTMSDTYYGHATYYQMGDYVLMFGKTFISKVNNNTGHLPTTTDAYWQQVFWTDGVKTYDYPPDDVRLAVGDMYNTAGMGLLDNPSGAIAAPTVSAGSNQTITTSSTSVTATVTWAAGHSGSLLWTKVSGTGTITSPSSATTSITGIGRGTSIFNVLATQDDSQTANSTVTITYTVLPTANAGADQTIALPTSSKTLSGSATNASGTTATYLWAKVSGAGTQTISGSTTLNPTISGMTTAGNYVFALTVTQSDGQTASDNVTITVNPAAPVRSNYYISNEGDDNNDGLTTATSWATIAKINSSGFLSGDSVLFKRGQSFIGSLIPKSNVNFNAYSTGNKPIINGFTAVSTWTNTGGNIWQSTDTVATNLIPNIVLVGGNVTGMGRTPNSTYNAVGSATSTSVTATGLSSGTWTGAEIVTRDEKYILTRRPITSQTGNTVNFASTAYSPRAGWGYFIQNSLATLDVQNEWYFNPTTKKISIYSVGTPAIVQVPAVERLVISLGKDSTTFKNLSFQGANRNAFEIGYSHGVTIDSCDFKYNGDETILGENWGSGNNSTTLTVKNSSFDNNTNSGIILASEFINATLQNNTFTNTGVLEGMSGSPTTTDGNQLAIFAEGANTLIQNNSIANVGGIGIRFSGQNTKTKYNFINTYNTLKGDQGGIYTYQNATDSGRIIRGNILLNGGIGNGRGTMQDDDSHGIYMDDNANGVLIDSNTVFNVAYSGIFLHNNTNMTVRNNTVYSAGYAAFLEVGSASNITSKNNIFIAKDSASFALAMSSANSLTADSNYYARPIFDTQTFFTDFNSGTYNLAQWKTYSSQDAHSHGSPIALSDTSLFNFLYNSTSSPVAQSLSGAYQDVKGVVYTGSITLPAHSGVVLMGYSPSVLPVIIRDFFIKRGKVIPKNDY